MLKTQYVLPPCSLLNVYNCLELFDRANDEKNYNFLLEAVVGLNVCVCLHIICKESVEVKSMMLEDTIKLNAGLTH